MKLSASPRGSRDALSRVLGRALPLLALLAGFGAAHASSVTQSSLVDLISESDRILVGTVTQVSDGFTEKNVPFTEVTITVSESLRGDAVPSYTFRQFGLKEPREIDGRTYLGVSPEGWPTWNERESVMLFLTPPARLTGLQTTVGLGQGKLSLRNGQLASSARNMGLFRDIEITASGLSRAQLEMLETDGKAVDANPFISLVRRAVDENWIENGAMRNEN